MTAHIEDVLLYSLTQTGDPYIFGAEAKASDPDPAKWDCSELVEWSCERAGVKPRVPDGAFNQWRHTRLNGTILTVDQGIRTRGALLFVGDGTGTGRDAITHVAWSLGDGTTIEARGSKWGVGTWPAAGRFNFAGLIPGVDYSARVAGEDDLMAASDDILRTLDGHGAALTEIRENLKKQMGRDYVDEAQLAIDLAPLLAKNMTHLSDADVTRIAKAAADEQSRRLAG